MTHGDLYGMQTFDQSLVHLYRNGLVARDRRARARRRGQRDALLPRPGRPRARARTRRSAHAGRCHRLTRGRATPGRLSRRRWGAPTRTRAPASGCGRRARRSSSGPGRSWGDHGGAARARCGRDGRDRAPRARPTSKGSDGPAGVQVRGRGGRTPRGACGATRRGGGRGAAGPQPRLRGATVEQVPAARWRHAVGVACRRASPAPRPAASRSGRATPGTRAASNANTATAARCSRAASRSGCRPLRRT